MAKKSRRVRRKGAQTRLSKAQLVQPTQKATEEAIPLAEVEAPTLARTSAATDFRKEYHYVVSDLQRIGLLAALMLGGLIVLSFLL